MGHITWQRPAGMSGRNCLLDGGLQGCRDSAYGARVYDMPELDLHTVNQGMIRWGDFAGEPLHVSILMEAIQRLLGSAFHECVLFFSHRLVNYLLLIPL